MVPHSLQAMILRPFIFTITIFLYLDILLCIMFGKLYICECISIEALLHQTEEELPSYLFPSHKTKKRESL